MAITLDVSVTSDMAHVPAENWHVVLSDRGYNGFMLVKTPERLGTALITVGFIESVLMARPGVSCRITIPITRYNAHGEYLYLR